MEETNGVLDPWVDSRDCPGSASRRTFILSLLAAIASACSGPNQERFHQARTGHPG